MPDLLRRFRPSVSRQPGTLVRCSLGLLALACAATAPAATIFVNSTADPAGYNGSITIPQLGANITLRDAINAVRNTGGTHTITFSSNLAGQTIELAQVHANNAALQTSSNSANANHLTIQGLTGIGGGVTISRASSVQTLGILFASGSASTLTINDLTIANGSLHLTSTPGAGIYVVGTTLNLNRCTLTGHVGTLGGALMVNGGTVNVTNCTIAGNIAYDQGGGIFHLDGNLTVTHSTITDNQSNGGGIYTRNGGTLLVNTIVAGNRRFANGTDIAGNGSSGMSPASHHNLIGDAGSAGGLSHGVNSNLVGVNPLLVGLTDNGGPTRTIALAAGSPALNAAASGVATTDQRGVARPQNGGVDIGAYELVAGAPQFTSLGGTAFAVGAGNSFNATATGSPAPTYSVTGALPAGVSFNASGLLSGTPANGTAGSYPLTLTATNSAGYTTQPFTLTIVNPIVVTTAADEDNNSPNPGLGAGTSLREAVNFANSQATAQVITFASNLAGQSVNLTLTGNTDLGASALSVTGNLTILGLGGNSGVTIRRGSSSALRPFYLQNAANLTLKDLTIADGLADYGGGIYNRGTLTMIRCTLRNNTATNSGGGLSVGGSAGTHTATLVNCTVANNSAQNFGGGIMLEEGALSLTNVTVAGNTTNLSIFNLGAGLQLNGSGAVLVNTIVANNNNPSGGSQIGGTLTATSHHNLIGSGISGGLTHGVNDNLVDFGNPKLGALAANGGPTQTMALQGSPAVNAGALVPGVLTDQRGVARPQNGAPDIGAFEFDGAITESLVVTTAVDELDFTSDPTFGNGTSLREALRRAIALGGAQTITFASAMAGATIRFNTGWNDAADASALVVPNGSQITLNGPTNGAAVTLGMADNVNKRHIYVGFSGSLVVSHLAFTGGRSADYGGSIWSQGALTVRHCTFTGNIAGAEGGAIQSWGDSPLLLIENSTFSGNSSNGIASAIDMGAASMTLRNVTITGNTGGASALVIYQNPVTMVNGIVAGNSVEGVGSANGGAFSAQSTNNLLGIGGSAGLTNGVNGNLVGVAAGDLRFGPLGANGGPTQTVALLPGSPAVDAGVALGGLTTDQRGTARPQGAGYDLGAFELVPSQAAATPGLGTAAGTYPNSVQVAISSSSPGATVRYTLDGSTPTATNGFVYGSPITLTQSATLRAVAFGRGWLASPVASATYAVLSPLPYWRFQLGLAADGSQDLANPSGDGLSNLQKYAFNLASNAGELARANYRILAPDGSAGLPSITRNAQGQLAIVFVRRKAAGNPGLAYVAEVGSDLAGWTMLSLGSASVVSIDATWERVTVVDPAVGSARRFGRVRLVSLTPYFNDFNASLGAASVRGSAVWTNQAVMLTDTIGGQQGSLVLDGPVTGPWLSGFTARFVLNIGPMNHTNIADGVSFAVGDLGAGAWGETGPGTAGSLTVSFDTFDNGGDGSIGLRVFSNGAVVGYHPTNPFTNGANVPVEVRYDAGSGLSVTFNGAALLNNVPLPGYILPANGRFGFGARTGGSTERAIVDDVRLELR